MVTSYLPFHKRKENRVVQMKMHCLPVPKTEGSTVMKRELIMQRTTWIQSSPLRRMLVLLISICTLLTTIAAQQPDTLIKKLDSLQLKKDSIGAPQINNIEKEAYNKDTKLTPASYFILIGSDLKQAFTKPFHMKKKEWLIAGGFIVLETGLSFLDEPIQTQALSLRNNSKAVRDISSYVTRFGGAYEIYTLLALGGYGLAFKKTKLVTTTLLATQAYITGEAVVVFTKFITGRQRPDYYISATSKPDPSFHGPFSGSRDVFGTKLNSSFPSGHTTVAFAAATVFAMEYKDKPLIPILSYTVASLIGISRIVEDRHWFSDVVCGAVLGYFSGKLVVNNYHRYAKLKAPLQKKNTTVFSLDYQHGIVMPRVVYAFR
ncbi:MAG: phosphatase PAP2 family protein [Bacteroidota bacterium]